MKKLDWNSFEKKIYIKAPVGKLYSLWATEKGISQWFLKTAEYRRKGEILDSSEEIKKGDTYTWRWHNWDGKEEGKILEANGKDFIVMEFGNSKLEVKFVDKGGITIVELKQYDIPQDEESKLNIYCGCNHGWTFWLTNLKAYLEHGILLNETEQDLRQHELAHMTFVNM